MKTISTDLVAHIEGLDVSSVDFQMDEATRENIKEAKEILKNNPVLQCCVIDGDTLNSSIVQFDSTIDDEEREELNRDNMFSFRTDVHDILIFRSGGVYFRGYGKWDGNIFYEFEIEI